MEPLPVATWSFTASADVLANAEHIRRGLAAADAAGAKVLVTPECGLTGYPGVNRASLADLDWELVRRCEDDLLAESRRRGLLLVIGTSSGPAAPGNQALIGGTVPGQRYHKRCLTPIDQAHFTPGQQPLVVAACNWRLGIGICYDLRFPDHWLDLAALDADAFLVLAHMAGEDPDPPTKSRLIPSLCAVRASETATPLVFANTAAADRYCDSAVWDARGSLQGHQGHGLLTCTVLPRSQLAPWYGQLRGSVLERWQQATR